MLNEIEKLRSVVTRQQTMMMEARLVETTMEKQNKMNDMQMRLSLLSVPDQRFSMTTHNPTAIHHRDMQRCDRAMDLKKKRVYNESAISTNSSSRTKHIHFHTSPCKDT
jgi:hypothetical protein